MRDRGQLYLRFPVLLAARLLIRRHYLLVVSALVFASLPVLGVVGGTSASAATAEPGRIVFGSADGIMSIEPNGSGLVKLGPGRSPAVISPDGLRVTGDTGGGKVWIVNIDGGGRELIGVRNHEFYAPTFTPNGNRLTAVHQQATSNWDLVTLDPRTGDWTEITDSDSVREWAPSWSPDGTQLAFWSDEGTQDGIRILDVASGVVGDVVIPTSIVPRVDWSPDGSMLVYGERGRSGLVTLDLTDPAALPEDLFVDWNVLGANFAPDGRIIFSSDTDGGMYQIYSVDPDGSDLVQETTGDSSKTHPDQAGMFLDLNVEDALLRHGHHTQLSTHLYPHAETDNDEVTLFRSIAGGAFKAFATPTVGRDGNVQRRIDPVRNTAYYASWSGDAGTPPASTSAIEVEVQPRFAGTLRGFDGTRGRYKLYRTGTIDYRVVLRPYQKGKPVNVYLDAHGSHGWHYVDNKRFSTNRRGSLFLTITSLGRSTFRIYSFFHGTESNPRAETGFDYFRVTGTSRGSRIDAFPPEIAFLPAPASRKGVIDRTSRSPVLDGHAEYSFIEPS